MPELACVECDYKASTKQSLRQHVRSDHRKHRDRHCNICDFTTLWRSSLYRHNRSVHLTSRSAVNRRIQRPAKAISRPPNAWPCNICDLKLSSGFNLRRHLAAVHTESTGNDFACNLCEFTANRKYHLERHVRDVHERVKAFKCTDCDYSSARRDLLAIHFKKKHSDEQMERKHVCRVCGFSTDVRKSLESHVASFHAPELKSFRCGECEYKTLYRKELTNHLVTAHNAKHSCDLCDFKSAWKKRLSHHVRTAHTGEKAFICTECKYQTNSKFTLDQHTSAVHLKLKRYECFLCEYRTGWKSTLSNHMKTNHQSGNTSTVHANRTEPPDTNKGPDNEPMSANEMLNDASFLISSESDADAKASLRAPELKSFRCTECDFKAPNKYANNTHFATVHKKLIINCTDCDYTTLYWKRLQRHVKRNHTEPKKYSCNMCDFTTSCSKYLSKHLRTIHKKGTEYERKSPAEHAIKSESCDEKEMLENERMINSEVESEGNEEGVKPRFRLATFEVRLERLDLATIRCCNKSVH